MGEFLHGIEKKAYNRRLNYLAHTYVREFVSVFQLLLTLLRVFLCVAES